MTSHFRNYMIALGAIGILGLASVYSSVNNVNSACSSKTFYSGIVIIGITSAILLGVVSSYVICRRNCNIQGPNIALGKSGMLFILFINIIGNILVLSSIDKCQKSEQELLNETPDEKEAENIVKMFNADNTEDEDRINNEKKNILEEIAIKESNLEKLLEEFKELTENIATTQKEIELQKKKAEEIDKAIQQVKKDIERLKRKYVGLEEKEEKIQSKSRKYDKTTPYLLHGFQTALSLMLVVYIFLAFTDDAGIKSRANVKGYSSTSTNTYNHGTEIQKVEKIVNKVIKNINEDIEELKEQEEKIDKQIASISIGSQAEKDVDVKAGLNDEIKNLTNETTHINNKIKSINKLKTSLNKNLELAKLKDDPETIVKLKKEVDDAKLNSQTIVSQKSTIPFTGFNPVAQPAQQVDWRQNLVGRRQ